MTASRPGARLSRARNASATSGPEALGPSPVAFGSQAAGLRGRVLRWATNVLARLPVRAWLGLSLVGTCWPLDWWLGGLRTQLLFTPLWVGYILTLDGLVFVRKGTSLWTRSRTRFLGLFAMSAPLWWLFEILNWRVQNWQYVGRGQFTNLQFGLLTTLCFATVVPAILTTAELTSTFISSVPRGPSIRPSSPVLTMLFASGVAMLTLAMVWPRYYFPFVWTSVLFITEPINAASGFPTLLSWTKDRAWKPVISLCAGGLICGLFWEMWNYFSFPKWTYAVPFVSFWHVFEMPLLGYGGYLPFALEVYALYNFVTGMMRLVRHDYVQL